MEVHYTNRNGSPKFFPTCDKNLSEDDSAKGRLRCLTHKPCSLPQRRGRSLDSGTTPGPGARGILDCWDSTSSRKALRIEEFPREGGDGVSF